MTDTPDRFGWARSVIGLAVLVLMLTCHAHAQNPRVDGVAQNNYGLPAGGATIAICSQPANTTTTPCTALAALCLSAASSCTGAQGGGGDAPNPLNADSLGNYFFYYKAGQNNYTLQIYGSGLTTKILVDQFAGGLSGSNHGIAYAETFSGANMGLKIAAAGASLLAQGGTVDATNFQGAQVWTTDVMASLSTLAVPVTVLVSCQVTIDVQVTQTISHGHVSLQSDCQNPWFGAGQAPQQAGARFQPSVNLSGPVIKIAGASAGISGVEIGNITIDCNSNATWGLDVDSVMGSVWPGIHQVQNCTTGGMLARVSGTTAAVGTQRNNFGSFQFQNVPTCLQLQGNDESGGPNNANTNFNHFGLVNCDFTGTAGLMCHNADSNTFDNWISFRISGVGLGADFGGPSSQDCNNNTFLQMDAGAGGLTQRSGNNGFNAVLRYLQNNSAPDPTIVGTGRLIWNDGNGIHRGSFVSGFYLNDLNARAYLASGVPLCFYAASTAACGTDYITNNASSHFMNYFSAAGHQFFSGYLGNFSTTGTAQTITGSHAATDQAFSVYQVNGVNKWQAGYQVNGHYIINDDTVAGGQTSLDIAQGTGAITVPGTVTIGNAGAGGVITNSAATTAAGSGQLLILFTTTSTASITSGQTGTTAGVCVVNVSYNGVYGLTVLSATQYYIAATGSEPAGCGGNTPGTTTLSTTSTTPLTIPGLKSASGTRYLCISTTGVVSSSAVACSGT